VCVLLMIEEQRCTQHSQLLLEGKANDWVIGLNLSVLGELDL